jgi:6-pyruvoyltetrahydropterin/6-carboxytetrahydropterin synthase
MYEVTIKRSFSAAHLLKEIGGKCETLHGHNFNVEVSVCGERLDGEGLLVDFRLVKRWTDAVLAELDHKYLNELDLFAGINPSSENIARLIFERIAAEAKTAQLTVSRITVWESENSRVSYGR